MNNVLGGQYSLVNGQYSLVNNVRGDILGGGGGGTLYTMTTFPPRGYSMMLMTVLRNALATVTVQGEMISTGP